MLKSFLAFCEFVCCMITLGRLYGFEQNICFLPTILGALSHERDYVDKNKIRSSCEHEEVF
jgi:hypothetical protein